MQPREVLSLQHHAVTAGSAGDESARVTAEGMVFAANALPALIAYLDSHVRYVWVNDGYSRWFHRTRKDIVGRHPSEVLGAAGWTAIEPYVERVLSGEEVAFDNMAFKDGAERVVRASYVPHRDDGGRDEFVESMPSRRFNSAFSASSPATRPRSSAITRACSTTRASSTGSCSTTSARSASRTRCSPSGSR